MTTPLDQTERARFTEGDMPTLPPELRNIIGEYGMARTDRAGPMEIQHRWELLIVAIKRYAAGAAREAWQAAIASRAVEPVVTDAMVHAALKVTKPGMYREDLRCPGDGPSTAASVEKDIANARKAIEAALRVFLTTPQDPPTAAKAAKETPQ